MLTSAPACSRCQTHASSSRTRAPRTRMAQLGAAQRRRQAAVHGRRVSSGSCAASVSTCAAICEPGYNLSCWPSPVGRAWSPVSVSTCATGCAERPVPCQTLAMRPDQYPKGTLLVPQASPGRQRVETWLQAGGAPLSPRAYRARALAELSRSTTFLERRRVPHHSTGGPLHGSDGGAEPAGGAHAKRPHSVELWLTSSSA